MQKLQESVFSIAKTTSLSSAVFSFLQPTEDFLDKTPLGGILRDTKYAWLALGPKFCVVDLRSGLKIAARTFGNGISSRITVTSVVELPTPLTDNSQQLIISLECDDTTSLICVFHINGSQLLRCIQTDVVITKLAVCDGLPTGPLSWFDGLVMAGTRKGEIIVFDLNRASLIQALNDISQGNEILVRGESNVASLIFLPYKAINKIKNQRFLAVENDDHLALLLNEDSFVDDQYIFRNPEGTVRMKAKQSHIRVTVVHYIPELGSLAVGFNFGAFQLWNLLNLELEFTSQVNVECLPVTHFGFQEPCDDPRAFCYLWVVFSVLDRLEEEESPLAVMYSLTYQEKKMSSVMCTDTKCLYQDFTMAKIRFQIELSAIEDASEFIGGRCVSCHTYSISSTLGEEGEGTMLNLCQLVWECWGDNQNSGTQHGMLLFDLDQWYKDQMPATQHLESNAFMSTARSPSINHGSCLTLDLRLDPTSISPYSHAMRLEEHFYPNSLQYDCVWLNTSEASTIHTVGAQRQIVRGISSAGPACLLRPAPLYAACLTAGLAPLYCDTHAQATQDEQRRFLLSVALEARLSRFLKRCAHDWATGTHSGVGCTLTFLIDWSWRRAIELKENAKELTAPLFTSSTVPDRNVVRCLEHCVQQLTQLTGLLDAVLTKCCNLVVPDALSEMEEKYKGIGTVSLYFQVVQWFVRVGLLPERLHSYNSLPYPALQLQSTYNKRRLKLNRLQDKSEEESANKSCALLYIDQLIENEFGGERVHQMWMKAGSESGLYPPPSLYALLRLYLLAGIAEEHKHSLLLYLLLDYSMLYDDRRYEVVIRRLMQFPTMFGLSNTAIKATQAFWHLDHRDFDFALDQLQCLTGNTLSDWQHHVVLSSLLTQKKTQAALQYLHVRKPAPIQINEGQVNDHDKLDDWQTSCDLYLARGLVFEALDVIRMCVQNAGTNDDKVQLLNFFYKGCRNTGQLSKVLQVTLLPFEEEIFIKYLKDCNEPQTSDILVMYYLQQARYLEAERYNEELRARKSAPNAARDALVALLRAALPAAAAAVARAAALPAHTRVFKPKPMSVYIQAKSPTNTFTYKSTFIQDTIENASETWINRPKMKKGLKRALNIEETPFICTPKMYKTKSLLAEQKGTEATPSKRPRLDLTPRTPKVALKVSETLSQQMASLLDMPEVETPHKEYERSGAGTPHSILKNRRLESRNQEAPSPVDSRYLDSDEELETASNHTNYSDSNKLLRFTIPTASEGSTPSPLPIPVPINDFNQSPDKEMDYETSRMNETMESPPKKFASEDKPKPKKTYKDIVKARKSLSISANSSLSDDPNTSIESIADIPITLINPRYSSEKKYTRTTPEKSSLYSNDKETEDPVDIKITDENVKEDKSIDFVPRTPSSRRSIRTGEHTPLGYRSRTTTPERQDSPVVTPLRSERVTRSRSRTPELSPGSSLSAIPEQPLQEAASATVRSAPRRLRSRSRTPERLDIIVKESPRLEVITESPKAQEEETRRSTRSRSRTPERLEKVVKESIQMEVITESPKQNESPNASPTRSLRSRSRTPEVELQEQPGLCSPRSLRSRSKTPEKLMSPKREHAARNKRSLSRIVLEANTFKSKQQEKIETELTEEKSESTPVKTNKEVTSLLDVTFSPIVDKSVLQSSTESFLSVTTEKVTKTSESDTSVHPLPAFTTINEVYTEKSVLHSYQSSFVDTTNNETNSDNVQSELKSLPGFTTLNDDIGKSVLNSFESSVAESSAEEKVKTTIVPTTLFKFNDSDVNKSVLGNITEDSMSKDKTESSLMTSDSEIEIKDWKGQDSDRVIQKEKERIVEIEREINEIEGEMSDDCRVESGSSEDSSETVEEESSEESDSASENELENEIISIEDSDESTSDANSLEIDEQNTEHTEKPLETYEKPTNEEIAENPIEIDERRETVEMVDDSNEQMNQACMSLMTDDNSDHSFSLNYSDGNNREAMETDQPIEEIVTGEVPHQVTANEADPVVSKTVVEIDEKNAKTLDVVDTTASTDTAIETITDKETRDAVLFIEQLKENNVNDKEIANAVSDTSKESRNDEHQTTDAVAAAEMTEEVASVEESQTLEILEKPKLEEKQTEVEESIVDEVPTTETTKETEAVMDVKQSDNDHAVINEKAQKTPESKDVNMDEDISIQIEIDSKTEVTKKVVTKLTEIVTVPETIQEETESEIIDVQKPTRGKKRSQSTSKSKDEEPKTPATRKRTQSTTSNQSETEKTPENTATPSRRRNRTPSSTEVRKILTRRASKELMEKGEDESIILEELTPRRRSTRSRSKKEDDNASVASESSVQSNKSKVSEDEVKVQVRKGRKSTLVTKPDLSVIPEVTSEESKMETVPDVSSELITRRPAPSEPDDDSNSYYDAHTIDRLTLLNKEDFDGSPDPDELRGSPDSAFASRPRQRIARAASETKVVPKPARITRRTSVDIGAATPESSPVRARRASFARACEALHTPKRRGSTDARSLQGSPSDTPTRRPSTPAADSQPKETGRRSRKTSDKNKE